MKKGYLIYNLENDTIIQQSKYTNKVRVLTKKQIIKLAHSAFKKLQAQEKRNLIKNLTMIANDNNIKISWVVL